MKSGIYTITNLIDNKIYVGESNNIKKRLGQHKSNLKMGRHSNLHLQRAVNKYGIENFIFEELELCEEQFLKSSENYWCNMLSAHNNQYGYNIDSCNPDGCYRKKSKETKDLIGKKAKERLSLPSNNPFYNKTHSDEVKSMLSRIHKGKKLSESHKKALKDAHVRGENHYLSKKVINTETGVIYTSIREASLMTGINKVTLRDYLRGPIKNKTKLKLYDEMGSDTEVHR